MILEIAQKNACWGHVKSQRSSPSAQEELSGTEGCTQDHAGLACACTKGGQKTAIINPKWQQLELTNKLTKIIILKPLLNLIACLKVCVIRPETAPQKINPAILPTEITRPSGACGRDRDILHLSSSRRETRAQRCQAKLARNPYVPLLYPLIFSLHYGYGLSRSLWHQEGRFFVGRFTAF